jgi:hypothetical protein
MDMTMCIVGLEEEGPNGRTLRISLCKGLEEVGIARMRVDTRSDDETTDTDIFAVT